MSVNSFLSRNNKKLKLYYSAKASLLFNFNLTANQLTTVSSLNLPTKDPNDYVILTYFHFYELGVGEIVDSGEALTVNTTIGFVQLLGGYDITNGILNVGVRNYSSDLTVIPDYKTALITYYVFMLGS